MRVRWALAAGLSALMVIGAAAVAGPAQAAPRPKGPNAHKPAATARSDAFPLRLESQGTNVRNLQERLVWLGFTIDWKEQLTGRLGPSTMSAVRDAQVKYFLPVENKVDQGVAARFRKVAGRIGQLPSGCLGSGPHMCADKTQKVIRFVRDGKVLRTVDVRFGVADGVHDTPEGSYSVYWKSRYATSRINCPNQVCASPADLAPMPYASFFNGDMAVHYSPTFHAYGYYPGGGSHGCINVRNEDDASYLFDNSPDGTPVIVYS